MFDPHLINFRPPTMEDLPLEHPWLKDFPLAGSGRVSAVIDWAFVDVGDPYYDLSIIRWYMRDEAEWQQFLSAYGLEKVHQERFDYCMALHKFLNV